MHASKLQVTLGIYQDQIKTDQKRSEKGSAKGNSTKNWKKKITFL